MRTDARKLQGGRHLLTGLWALGLILYFIIEYALVVPYSTLEISWLPDGSAVVIEDYSIAADGSGSAAVQAGDILQAIDGLPVLNSDLHFRFWAAAPSHSYGLSRDGNRFAIDLPSGTPSPPELLNLALPGLVALEAWLVGFVILLLAPNDNRDARLVGFVMVGFGLALAGAPAAALGIPGSRLAYEILAPIVSVGYLEIAFLPRQTGRRNTTAFRVLYGIAAIVAALALIEIFYLNPETSWQFVVGLRLETLVLAMLGLSFLSAPVIMAIRAKRQVSAYTQRQIVILLVGTGVALLPFIVFTALPRVITGESWLPLEITLPLLGAIPATYAYVILRHRYLSLDIFVARSIVLLLVIIISPILFVSGYRVARLFPALTSLAPAVGMAVLFVGFGVLGRTSNRIRPAFELLLYGPDRHYDQTLIRLRDELLADPQAETLKKVLLEHVPEVLDVREAALLLADSDGKLLLSANTPGALATALPASDFNGGPAVLLHQTEPSGRVFRVVPWARLAVLLQLRGQTVGLLMLGGKGQSDYFDARDVRFLQRLAAWAGVAIENVRLFEALQDMAAERLRVRAAERTQLANRLHDEPLQRAYAIARDLEQLSSAQPEHSALAGELNRQREEVRELSRELRGITSGLRPPILNQGLMFALDYVIRRFTERFPGVGVERAVASEEPPPLSDEALDAAYFVVTEALTNVGKHTQASRVLVRVESLADAVRIIVSDNGESAFLANLSWVELARDQHHGILGMHQWAKAAQGRLRMNPVQPRGTEIELTLPLNGITNNG